MVSPNVYSVIGHIWAFNAVGWFGIYLVTQVPAAGVLAFVCLLPAVRAWGRSSK